MGLETLHAKSLSIGPSDHAIHFFSKFKRPVVITRLVENPDLAGKYHNKLQAMHAMAEMLKDQEALASNTNELIRLLNEAEKHLTNTEFLAGAEFSMVDCEFIPVLAKVEVLKLDKEYFRKHPCLIYYFEHIEMKYLLYIWNALSFTIFEMPYLPYP